ncbi:MAG: hypothetical protein JNG88_10615 [Phycisphaerales bacterium]|nr:hypothetical protein [Phycisphaerales bacterium]
MADATDGALQPVDSGSALPSPDRGDLERARRESRRLADVWSRTEPKYRRRALYLLLLNAVLFCGLCVFVHWLRVGRLFDFSLQSYYEPARFWGETTRSLNDFLLYPISVENAPIHGVVLGLLFASIVAVPITISILYRPPFALPFLLAVFVFAHMPWMALCLVLSITLAGARSLMLRFRFGSALIGMLPVLLYLYFASRGSADVLVALTSPMQKSMLILPWVLAILAACVMMAVMLLIAHLVKYRPGAIAPVVAVMFATPVLLFHWRVGSDELAYRVLENEIGPRSTRFEAVEDTRRTQERIYDLMHRFTLGELASNPFQREFMAAWSGQIDPLKQLIWRRFALDFQSQRSAAYEQCNRFLADHPNSRYLANVLYIQARILDTRIDERKIHESPPRRELYTDFPHPQAEAVWSVLWKEYTNSPLAGAAGLRLAQLELRAGNVDAALQTLAMLERIGPALSQRQAPQSQPAGAAEIFRAPLPESTLDFEIAPLLREARRLTEIILANRDDQQFGNDPLVSFMSLDPHRPQYLAQLAHLAQRYRESTLADNLVVTWVMGIPEVGDRAKQLARCVAVFPDGDAVAEALFRLADLEIQTLSTRDETVRTAGVSRMREVESRFSGSYWGEAATERLKMLEPQSARAAHAVFMP